jgi:hypothetical protein
MKKVLLALLLFFGFFAIPVQAADIYISQTGGGAGSSCSSPRAVSSLVGGDWAADNIIHLCGTITSTLTAQGSGTSGHPITVRWETGAILTQPVCPALGCFNATGRSFITLDGGGTGNPWLGTFVPNGIIQATANGTNLANHIRDSELINVDTSTGIIIKNLVLQNAYVHVAGSDVVPSPPDPSAIHAQGTTNLTIDKNVIHDALWAIYIAEATTGATITNNEIYFMDHGVAVGLFAPAITAVVTIKNNLIHDWAKWDTTQNAYHHDGVHNYQINGGTFQVQIIKNKFYGDPGSGGAHTTSHIFNEGNSSSTSVTVIENLFTVPANTFWNNGSMCLTVGPTGTMRAYNNTVVTISGQNNQLNKMEGLNADFRNNVILLNSPAGGGPAANTIGATAPTFVSNGLANNFYGLPSTGGQWFAQIAGNGVFLTFTQWKALFAGGSGQELNSQAVLTTALNLNPSTGQPGAGSPAIGGGQNLTSLCGTYPDLCTDINGNSRPGSGAWDAGAYQSGTSVSPPGTPGTLTGSPSGSSAILNWGISSGTVSGYTVKRATVNGGPYTQVAQTTSLTYTDTNLAAGTYYYVVSAFNASGSSGNSNQATVVIPQAVSVPGAPTNLTATATGSTINLSWTSSLGTPTNYIVRRATVSGGPYTTIATLGLVNSYSDSGLANGTYYYVVAASNLAGTSPNSTQASATVITVAALNAAPSSLNLGSIVIGQTGCGGGNGCVVTVTSAGTSNLILAGSNAVTISGPNAADFSIVGGSTTCTNGLVMVPNATCIITLAFTPSISGTEIASLVIVSNDPQSPDSVSLAGVGTIAVTISPTSLPFGNQYVNKTSTAKSVTFFNTSGVTIAFSSIAITGGDSSQFSISANGCGATLGNGLSCTVSVTFTPTSNGSKSSTLRFTYSGTSGSPQDVPLTGNGSRKRILKVGAVIDYHFPRWARIETLVYRYAKQNEVSGKI